jgi:protein-disulfide isomerase
MRPILALLGLLFLTAAAPARDWSTVATQAPSGVFVIGNPAARVKIVEWASYTCSHCAAFANESAPVLKGQMIRSGSTSLEVHHLVRDPLDLAAGILARCAGPRGYAGLHAAIFAGQEKWLQQGATYLQANAPDLEKLPKLAAFRRIADGAGLTAIAHARGLTEPQVAACFASQPGVDKLLALGAAAPAEVTGTPTFYVNGKLVPNVGWAQLEPALRAAGAK